MIISEADAEDKFDRRGRRNTQRITQMMSSIDVDEKNMDTHADDESDRPR